MMPRSPAQSPAPTGKRIISGAPSPRQGPKDFSYLLRPEIYHPLSPLAVPPPFRNPRNPPDADTPIPDLLARGYFRAAAIAAAQTLTSGALDPTDHARIFDLFYIRLACLTLVDATPLAAQEVKALGDLHSAFYYCSSPATQSKDGGGGGGGGNSSITGGETTPGITAASASPRSPAPPPPPSSSPSEHVVPWPLRLLAVRLQALGFGDPRRAVMSYYELAREARARLGAARARHDHSASEAWRERLADLGVRVAGALVEMDDLAGALVHLGTLTPRRGGGGGGGNLKKGMVAVRMALLWLQLGDVDAARACVGANADGGGDGDGDGDGVEEKVVSALCDVADGEYEAALEKWRALREQVDDEMVGVNLAVCLLYVGKMQEVLIIRPGLVDFVLSPLHLPFPAPRCKNKSMTRNE